MSLSRICPVCKSTFKVSTLQCPRCRVNLSKLKVRVRVGHGWKTLVTENLQAADEFQRRWSTTNTETTKQSEKAPPPAGQKPQQHSQSLQGLKEVTLREVFNSFISWAETHKRSWRSDLQLCATSLIMIHFLTKIG